MKTYYAGLHIVLETYPYDYYNPNIKKVFIYEHIGGADLYNAVIEDTLRDQKTFNNYVRRDKFGIVLHNSTTLTIRVV